MRWIGWYPTRRVLHRLELPAGVSLFPEAAEVLDEFGGLKIHHPWGTFYLDPMGVVDDSIEVVGISERLIGQRCYRVGYFDGCDYLDLLLSESGVVYSVSDELKPFAINFDRAIYHMWRCTSDQKEVFRAANVPYIQAEVFE